MSIEIDPIELGFHRPFTTEVSETLKIRNPNHTPVAFKVKTTAPKQYCVRPNSGRIEPGKEVEVTVLLQAMKQQPPLDAKCRDKFLVQSVAITADREFESGGSVQVDDADKSAVQEKKIRVVFLAPGTSKSAAGISSTPLKNAFNGPHDSSNAALPGNGSQRSPSPEAASYTPDTRTRRQSVGQPAIAESVQFTSSPPDYLAATSAAAPPLTYEELKVKLAEAQETIASYAQGGLRMRKVTKEEGSNDNEKAREVAQQVQQSSQGVPLKIVAALCLFSFLLAYILF